MHLFSERTFHHIFSHPRGKKKDISFSSSPRDVGCLGLNDNKALVYEDMSEEDLFIEALEGSFVPHIPPFNFEQESDSIHTLTILLPGIHKNRVNIVLQKNKIIVRIHPCKQKNLKEKSKKVFHKGIFDILMPAVPFESTFKIPALYSLKEYSLSQGLLKIIFEKKNT